MRRKRGGRQRHDTACKPANLVHISTCQVVGRAANDQPIIVSRTRVFCDGPDTPFVKLCGSAQPANLCVTFQDSYSCRSGLLLVFASRPSLYLGDCFARCGKRKCSEVLYAWSQARFSIIQRWCQLETYTEIYVQYLYLQDDRSSCDAKPCEPISVNSKITTTAVYRTKTMHATCCTWTVS